ncbi:MAG: hypothetical protein VX614_10670 [Myxococcota bacterium]|nr:hypothetical protein [Myxococcota bacterium]
MLQTLEQLSFDLRVGIQGRLRRRQKFRKLAGVQVFGLALHPLPELGIVEAKSDRAARRTCQLLRGT